MANSPYASQTTAKQTNLQMAGWFLMAAGIWELAFNRLASAMGLYSNVGAAGFLSVLASSGRFAMNATGIMALVLSCVFLPRLASAQRFAPRPIRFILLLVSPLYLPILCVAIFRPVGQTLILFSYVVATGSAILIAVSIAIRQQSPNIKRVAVILGLMEMLAAVALLIRWITLSRPSDSEFLITLPRNIYFLSEILYVIIPVLSFFVLTPGKLRRFVLRPHLLGLLFSLLITGLAAAIAFYTTNEEFLRSVAYRTLGITMAFPGGLIPYLVALFFGALLVGTLFLPSKRWPANSKSRRTGFGLTCLLLAGIQPTHPYQFIMMFIGFLYLTRGLIGDISDDQFLEELQPY
jgi:hypothetical protein